MVEKAADGTGTGRQSRGRLTQPCDRRHWRQTVADAPLGRCVAWSRAWSCDSLTVVHLFAFRVTKPKDLLSFSKPVRAQDGATLTLVPGDAVRVVAARGSHGCLVAETSRDAVAPGNLPRPHLAWLAVPPPARHW